jgi:hypothetical protein
VSGSLQYRTTQPEANANPTTVTVYNQFSNDRTRYYQLDNAVRLTADPNTSTAPGDSGGPLFLVSSVSGQPQLFLIGVTSGSDMALAPEPCPPPNQLRVNNIATSLQYCYQNYLI